MNRESFIKTSDSKAEALVDLDLYAKEAIAAVLYRYSGICHVFQQREDPPSHFMKLVFETKDGASLPENFHKEFFNDLLDQQVRWNINQQFGRIRDAIVEEAFRPISGRS